MITVKIKKETVLRGLVYAAAALFYLWLASCVPYTHDDWDWGLSNGITQLLTASINSRYAGNFFVVVMTRSRILKTILMGVTCFLVPMGIAGIAARDIPDNRQGYQLQYFLLANFLILTMGYETWRETYGWVSGFANYVISTVFLLMNLQKLLRFFEEEPKRETESFGKAVLWGCSGFLGQLFLENLALYMVVLVFFIGFLYYKKYRRIPKPVLAMAAGVVLGLGVMFSSSIYSTLWQTGSAVGGVRQLSFRADSGLMENVKRIVLQTAGLVRRGGEKQCFLSCTVLCLLAYGLGKGTSGEKKYTKALIAGNGCIGLYFCAATVFGISYTDGSIVTALLGAAANFLYFAVVTAEVFLVFREDKREMGKAALLWLSVIVYLAPMVVTTVYGPRLYYVSNIFIILLICRLIRYMGLDGGRKKHICLTTLAAVGVVVLALHAGVVYHAIDRCNEQRLALMEQAAAGGEQEVVLPKYPYEQYLWMPDPISEEREGYYKAFYGLPQDMVLRFECIH